MTRLSPRQTSAAARLRDALRSGGLDDFPDSELLDRFARYGEHAAFEVLLRRHAAMVFGVCRRVLANTPDAEDAFQATFLVFVRKARSVRRGDRLGPWLYGVAFRVATKARARAARLSARSTEATDMLPDLTTPPEARDWLPILDAEVNALPAKYREPLVLCELQGASRADAAKALGIPEGTLSSRLSRGRDLLRRRLLKHGTLLPAGGLAALFAANGVGRAAVPAGLLAKTSDLAAVVAAGAAVAGAVPAGPARLTDEVLKGMMLAKLRLTGAALLAFTLMAVGAAAAVPGESHDGPGKSKQSAKAKAAPANSATPPADPNRFRGAGQELRVVEFVDGGTVLSDRERLQGLWVLDKFTSGKGPEGEVQEQLSRAVGKMHFLVGGDVWWAFMIGQPNSIYPQLAKIDASKNPKWVDLTNLASSPGDTTRCIYELDGDKLRVCMVEGDEKTRPAEFATDEGVGVMHFRREKLPPAAGEKALVGSWEGMGIHKVVTKDGITAIGPAPRVEILDGFLFAYLPDRPLSEQWVGGKYTVDTTKNPKWIDVDLVCTFGGVTKLYGCYELEKGRLRLALGTKRATRPLEFAEAPGVIFLALGPTKEPLGPTEKVVREEVPAPRPKDAVKPNPTPPASAGEDVDDLMRAGKFAEAEDRLRVQLAQASGLRAAERRLLLAVCLIERAKGFGEQGAATLRSQAQENLSLALKELDSVGTAGGAIARAAWVRTQCEIRNLQILQKQGKAAEVLAAVEPLWVKHRGTVEELILTSFAYHAYLQKGQQDKAAGVRHHMKELFDRLKDKPDGFPEKTGEFSRDYWEKTWFGEGK
jgi:RNA polymerase sigma factor (sigma-70 family)